MKKELRTVPSFPRYKISSDGELWSFVYSGEPKLKSFFVNPKGYYVAGVHRQGKQYCKKRAFLICEAWHGPKPEGAQCVRHLNDIKTDDRADNLAWGTYKDNAKDAIRNGTSPSIKLRKKFIKLDEEKVKEIKARLESGEYQYLIAKRFGVTQANISVINKGLGWANVKAERDRKLPKFERNHVKKGEAHSSSKFSDSVVLKARELYSQGLTVTKTARKMNELGYPVTFYSVWDWVKRNKRSLP